MLIFYQLSVVFLIAGIMGLAVSWLRQPPLVGYLLSGILLGPAWLQVVGHGNELELYSKIGVAFLLFAVGLHLEPRLIKETGLVAIFAGMGQIISTTLLGWLLLLGLGMKLVPALYVALALTFSSTIVAVKSFSDRKEMEKLYAKIAIGILLVQDLAATIILLVISMVGNSTTDLGINWQIAMLVGKVCILSMFLIIMANWVIPYIFRLAAGWGEVLFLLAVGWGLSVASLFSVLNLSMEIGALLAGVALSGSNFNEEISSRLKPVRDLFLAIFFVLLGTQIDTMGLAKELPLALVLSLFVLVGGPVITWVVLRAAGQGNKVGVFAGFSMAQISEFSLILMALGRQVGQVGREETGLVALVALITISISSYIMHYSEILFGLIRPFLNKLWPAEEKEAVEKYGKYRAALFGYDRVGVDFVNSFRYLGKKFFVVDFNPQAIAKLRSKKIEVKYGDADDVEFLESLPTNNLELVVSTIPDLKTNQLLCKFLSKNKLLFIGLAHTAMEAKKLYEAGAGYVIMPHYLGAKHASGLIKRLKTDPKKFERLKLIHLNHLSDRLK